ncbi:DUF4838 domain-containing protein [Paenibacillus mendelii]|uniref:DUF4838 domain-containing protein n=1 Tax=Paenibacillus mendelii TaxID=206163 RepID=A0ABV6JEF9_9BACL|nr:DUF4838 domain-containing protein [Paenibacillus mendelii]MCQ6557153.1 DUF4838 domain-containing protein [Paenibacillus mendelii]
MADRRGIVLDLDDLHEGWPDLLHKANINVLGLHNWSQEHESSQKIDAIIDYFQSAEGVRMAERLRTLNIGLEFELHAMSWLLPREHYPSHPEWFRMDDSGERRQYDNLCPSNEEAMEVVRSNAAILAQKLKPTTDRYYMWQDDNKPWCRCERCRPYSTSDQNLLVMNAIQASIQTIDQYAKLSYLAYTTTLDSPPEKIKPRKGVFLEVTGPGIHQMNNTRPSGIHDEKFQQSLERNLQVFGVEHAQVLEYWLDSSLQSGWKKPVSRLRFDEAAAAYDIGFYESKGISSITTFGVFLDEVYFQTYGAPPIEAYGRLLGGNR